MDHLLLASLLALGASAGQRSSISPPEPPGAQPSAPHGETAVMQTGHGELRWVPGEPEVAVLDGKGRVLHRIPLARPDRKPKPGATLRALLPPRGRSFLVVEETRSEVGIHLAERLAAKKPKATVVRSVLRLVDESSRMLWERPTEDKTLVGGSADPQHLQIAPNGAVAMLLQDVDPYSKNRPLLSVVDPRGREALRLDYTAWARVDEFALSPDGRELAVHGFGLVPEEGEMSRAIGYYRVGKGPAWIKALPREARSQALRLQTVNADGWACCVEAADGWTAFDHGGLARRVSEDVMWREFGIKP